jgi:hypothetical protein
MNTKEIDEARLSRILQKKIDALREKCPNVHTPVSIEYKDEDGDDRRRLATISSLVCRGVSQKTGAHLQVAGFGGNMGSNLISSMWALRHWPCIEAAFYKEQLRLQDEADHLLREFPE